MKRNYFEEFAFRYRGDEDLCEMVEIVLRSMIKTDDKCRIMGINDIGCDVCKNIHNHKRIEAAIRGLNNYQDIMESVGDCESLEDLK